MRMQKRHVLVLARVLCLLLVVALLSFALLLMWETKVSNVEGLSLCLLIFIGVTVK